MRHSLVLIGVPVLLAACASAPVQAPPAGPDKAAEILDKAISGQHEQRDVHADSTRPAPSVQWDAVHLDYFGDAAVLLRSVAKDVGLGFATTGPGPHIPIFVQISAKGDKLEEVLRQMALQLGGRADIVLRNDLIELRYRAHR